MPHRVILPLCCVLSLFSGACSDDATGQPGPGTGSGNVLTMSIPVMNVSTLGVSANVPMSSTRAFEIPAGVDVGVLKSLSFDVKATLPHLTIQRTDLGTGPTEPKLTLRIAVRSGTDTNGVCENGIATEATISGDEALQNLTAEPETVTVGADSISVVNSGSFAVCFQAEANFDGEISLDALEGNIAMDVENCTEDAPEPMAGVWSGTYLCENHGCSQNDGGPISLTILQADETAIYFDESNAVYFGSVCGNTFTFFGGAAFYSESGKFTKTGDKSGMKTSTWIDEFDSTCGGDCTDMLTLN